MQKNLGKLLDKISHESSFNSVQHTYGVVNCQDLETWDGDIWYNDDDLEADSHPTPKAEKVQPLIETETVHEGGWRNTHYCSLESKIHCWKNILDVQGNMKLNTSSPYGQRSDLAQ